MFGPAEIDILKELLTHAKKQEEFMMDGHFEEALDLQRQRESIIAPLKESGVKLGEGDDEARGLISRIDESDKKLTMLVELGVSEITGKLKKSLEIKGAIKAYSDGMRT